MKKTFIALVFLMAFACIGNASDPKFTGIVASKSFIGQTSNLSNVAIYTPDSDGTFRVTVYVEDATGGGASDAGPKIAWTDTQSRNQSLSASGPSQPLGDTLVLRDQASTSITLSTSSINASIPVDIYAVVERIQ